MTLSLSATMLYVIAVVLLAVAAYLSTGARDRIALIAAALTVFALGLR